MFKKDTKAIQNYRNSPPCYTVSPTDFMTHFLPRFHAYTLQGSHMEIISVLYMAWLPADSGSLPCSICLKCHFTHSLCLGNFHGASALWALSLKTSWWTVELGIKSPSTWLHSQFCCHFGRSYFLKMPTTITSHPSWSYLPGFFFEATDQLPNHDIETY